MGTAAQHREAVIAIQGGGVYGLSLIGQLQAVVEDHRYGVLALAGTSAGAIVAALAWAGISPKAMRRLFVQMASSKSTPLEHLLAPYEPQDFDLDAFKKLIDQGSELLKSVTTRAHSLWRPKSWGTVLEAADLIKKLSPHYRKRGVFSGRHLERTLELLLRARLRGIERIVPQGEPLRFSHIAKYIEANKSFLPPLLLTVTNLTKQRIQVISSIDPKYANVPVAKAVRASAGYPGFFTPEDMPECPEGGWFVDGGVVSNFPIWTFSEALREEIQKSDLEPIYGHLVNKPWIRIGLRVMEDPEVAPDLTQPRAYFASLLKMMTGGSRNELEEMLSQRAARSIVIKQPYSKTGGPDGFLNIKALDADRVHDMIVKGREWANVHLRKLGSPAATSEGPETTTRVTQALEDLVHKCELIFAKSIDCAFRANVFMPVRVGNENRMRLLYSVNMAGDTDSDMEFPDLQSGATGFCYWSRRPQVCNLEKIAKAREADPTRMEQMFGKGPASTDLFGMEAALQRKVREDRSWLASVPIFDPHEVRVFDPKRAPEARLSKHKGRWHVDIDTEIEGPLLGVLNLDAGWKYSDIGLEEDPPRQLADKRVQAVLAIMQATSFAIAKSLGGTFPGQQ